MFQELIQRAWVGEKDLDKPFKYMSDEFAFASLVMRVTKTKIKGDCFEHLCITPRQIIQAAFDEINRGK